MTDSQLSPAVITVGEELVWGELANVNQQWMLQWLKEQDQPAGIAMTLPDHQDTIAKWLRELHKEFYLIFLILFLSMLISLPLFYLVVVFR